MTYLDLVKKLGLTKLIICLMDELGYPNKEIAKKLQITEPTIYNARKSYELLNEALQNVGYIQDLITVDGDIKVEQPKRSGTITEAIKQDLRNPDVQKIVDEFQTAFGTTSVSRYDRFAASRLAKKYGAESITQVIQLLAQHAGDKYTPVVSNVRQIEQKWVNIASFFKRIKQNEGIEDL